MIYDSSSPRRANINGSLHMATRLKPFTRIVRSYGGYGSPTIIPCNTIIIIRLFNALINKATVNIISVSIPDYRSQNHIAMIVHHNCSKHSSEGFHSTTLSPQLKNYYDGYTQCFDLCNSLTPDIPFKARIIMRSTKIVTCKLNTSLPINMDSSWRLDPPLR